MKTFLLHSVENVSGHVRGPLVRVNQCFNGSRNPVRNLSLLKMFVQLFLMLFSLKIYFGNQYNIAVEAK